MVLPHGVMSRWAVGEKSVPSTLEKNSRVHGGFGPQKPLVP